MDKKRILHIGIVIIIAILLLFLIFKIKDNIANKVINNEIKIQQQVIKDVDSLRIINRYLEIQNQQDGTTIKHIKINIIKNDSVISNLSAIELQKLLYNNINKE